MPNLGKLSVEGLEELRAAIKGYMNDGKQAFMVRLAHEIGRAVQKMAAENTPKVTGVLRREWKYAAQTKGDQCVITIYNRVEYSPYVEFGHRQVVVVDGQRIEKGWVEGRHMLSITMAHARDKAVPDLIERRVLEELQKVMEGEE